MENTNRAPRPARTPRVPAWKKPLAARPEPTAAEKAEQEAYTAARRAERAADTSGPATDRQVAAINRMATPEAVAGCWAEIPADIAGIRALTKTEASMIISALEDCR